MSYEKCPWCKTELKDIDDSDFTRDGDTVETECPSCEKGIEITASYSVDYHVAAIGCEKHELDLSTNYDWIVACDGVEQYRTKNFGMTCKLCGHETYDWKLPNGTYPRLKEGQFELVGKAKEIMEMRTGPQPPPQEQI